MKPQTLFSKEFKSYEGEGNRIGIKTQFLTFTGEGSEVEIDMPAIYIVANSITEELYQFCLFWSRKGKLITVEVKDQLEDKWYKMRNVQIFYNVDEYKKISNKKKDFIKLEFKSEDIEKYIELAKKYEEEKRNGNILLMPLEEVDMKSIFDKIPNGVRFMPPIQKIISID